jgi:hypothetical protein
MAYLQNLNRSNYELEIAAAIYDKSKLVFQRKVAVLKSDDNRSRMSLKAFLGLLDRAESIDCIVDEKRENGVEVVMTNVNTSKNAVLRIRCSNGNYTAEVLLNGHREVSFKAGAETASKTIEDYLLGRKTTKQLQIVRDAEGLPEDVLDGEYSFFTRKFSE